MTASFGLYARSAVRTSSGYPGYVPSDLNNAVTPGACCSASILVEICSGAGSGSKGKGQTECGYVAMRRPTQQNYDGLQRDGIVWKDVVQYLARSYRIWFLLENNNSTLPALTLFM